MTRHRGRTLVHTMQGFPLLESFFFSLRGGGVQVHTILKLFTQVSLTWRRGRTQVHTILSFPAGNFSFLRRLRAQVHTILRHARSYNFFLLHVSDGSDGIFPLLQSLRNQAWIAGRRSRRRGVLFLLLFIRRRKGDRWSFLLGR